MRATQKPVERVAPAVKRAIAREKERCLVAQCTLPNEAVYSHSFTLLLSLSTPLTPYNNFLTLGSKYLIYTHIPHR